VSTAPGERNQPVTIRFTSDTCEVANVRAAVEAAARDAGFSEMDVSGIVLAIDEAICNVIRHGYEGRSGQPIELVIEYVCREQRGGLQFTLRDNARQVDPSSIVGRDLEDIRPGGLGTHIIRAVMDEVEYTSRQPQGMELRLLKWLGQGDSAPRQETPDD
jgi:anti-sigma regulatory factor (Ser/Thr protein kinase)